MSSDAHNVAAFKSGPWTLTHRIHPRSQVHLESCTRRLCTYESMNRLQECFREPEGRQLMLGARPQALAMATLAGKTLMKAEIEGCVLPMIAMPRKRSTLKHGGQEAAILVRAFVVYFSLRPNLKALLGACTTMIDVGLLLRYHKGLTPALICHTA